MYSVWRKEDTKQILLNECNFEDNLDKPSLIPGQIRLRMSVVNAIRSDMAGVGWGGVELEEGMGEYMVMDIFKSH